MQAMKAYVGGGITAPLNLYVSTLMVVVRVPNVHWTGGWEALDPIWTD